MLSAFFWLVSPLTWQKFLTPNLRRLDGIALPLPNVSFPLKNGLLDLNTTYIQQIYLPVLGMILTEQKSAI